jgi:hypothetical protein
MKILEGPGTMRAAGQVKGNAIIFAFYSPLEILLPDLAVVKSVRKMLKNKGWEEVPSPN